MRTQSIRTVLFSSFISGLMAMSQPSFATTAGTLISSEPLAVTIPLPPATADAYRLTYWSTASNGDLQATSGTLLLPMGTPPGDGWPVLAWAHGTTGIADTCAPSLSGPALPARDNPYLEQWLAAGYAVVATDYIGLGTDGFHPYLEGKTAVSSIRDMVSAAHAFAELAPGWVVAGQSQGGAAALHMAFAGDAHDPYLFPFPYPLLGAIATGTPAYVENMVPLIGPALPINLGPDKVAVLSYLIHSLMQAHPELNIDSILTPAGRDFLELAATTCLLDLQQLAEDQDMRTFFTAGLNSLPAFTDTLHRYMALPETGLTVPVWMGHGLFDNDAAWMNAASYATAVQFWWQPLHFRSYWDDHNGTLLSSQADALQFAAEQQP